MTSYLRRGTAILAGTILIVLLLSAGAVISAYAQYMGNVDPGGQAGKGTLEETLKLSKERVDYAAANPSSGSGTPYLAADGVLGASAIAGAVFGGIAATFFFRGRYGRYAAVGRG